MCDPGWSRTFTQFACSQSDQKITTVWKVKRKQKMAPERAHNLHLDKQRCPSWNWTGSGQLSTTTPSEALRINTLQEVQRNGNPSLRLDSYPTCVSNEDNAIMMCPVDESGALTASTCRGHKKKSPAAPCTNGILPDLAPTTDRSPLVLEFFTKLHRLHHRHEHENETTPSQEDLDKPS